MATKKQITDVLKERFANVVERGRVLGLALKARADIAVTRRRLRSTLADLGEKIYARMESDQAGELGHDPLLVSFQERISGLKAELRLQEAELKEIVAERKKGGESVAKGQTGEGGEEKEKAGKEGEEVQ
jgi:hypothetical protein